MWNRRISLVTWSRLLLIVAAIAFGTRGLAEGTTRIVVISDLNGSYGSTSYNSDVHSAVDAIISMQPDLVLSTGDMVAGQRRPHLSESEIKAMWQAFHAAVTDPLASAGIPLAVTPGNHDGSAYRGFEKEREIYRYEWLQRQPDLAFSDASGYPFFYSFDIGPARIVSLDATRVGALDAEQMDGLKSAFDDAGPARIVFGHLPIWPFAQGRDNEIIGDPDLAPLLLSIGVDLHLSGHHHAFFPGQVDGLSVVSQAEMGGGSRRLIGSSERSGRSMTLIEIAETGEIAISALRAPDFRRRVDVGLLPVEIRGRDRVIYRLDTVSTEDVSVKEH